MKPTTDGIVSIPCEIKFDPDEVQNFTVYPESLTRWTIQLNMLDGSEISVPAEPEEARKLIEMITTALAE
jgi:hypothetical protein